jgi:hypothetical protein
MSAKALEKELLRSARVAELRTAALELAKLCRPVNIEVPKSRRRLLVLLACERRRCAKLVETING